MAYTTINDPTQYFNTVLYTGDGLDNKQVTNGGNSDLQPDLIWVKNRTQAYNNIWQDTSRGLTTAGYLTSNGTQTESGATTVLVKTATSNGFTVGTSGAVNWSGDSLVAWQWKANGGTTSSNTDGSITSTVQANTTAGFSIVTYTGTGANATVGHGLGVAPKMIICKQRNNTLGHDWLVYHEGIGNTKYIPLSSTQAATTASTAWQNTTPTSSVFSVGTSASVNESGKNQLAYCFAEIKGYSKFGSYTGNGSTDGTFVYTGFKPAFILTKRTDTVGQWYLKDTKRSSSGGFNTVGTYLKPNSSDAEGTNDGAEATDILSNGFKQRNTEGNMNASGGTYIYMAFAESPFVSSDGVPTTAR